MLRARVPVRAWFVLIVLSGGLLAAAARAVYVTTKLGPRLFPVLARQRGTREPIPAPLGDIVDRHGRLLATCQPVYSLYVNPRALPADQIETVLRPIADALRLPLDGIVRRVRRRQDRYFVWLKRRLSEAELSKLVALQLDPRWFGFRREYRRVYPKGRLAAHVLGFRDIDLRPHGGIEQAFDHLLRGTPGERYVLRDAAGRPVHVDQTRHRRPEPGDTIQLTIDAVIQYFAEEALREVAQQWRPRGGMACVVLDPHTGEVLALASWPVFDPNTPAHAPPEAWLNRAIGAVYEPGSTFKPFIAAAALNWGVVSLEEPIDCHNGVYRMGRRVLHSDHPHGVLPFAEVLIRSDNIGMAVIGERLGLEGVYRAVELFGFGRPTGIELPGEVRGKVQPFHLWNYYSLGSVPMGHEVGVTPLQLLRAFAALANGGYLLKPTVIKRVLRCDGQVRLEHEGAVVERRVVRAEVTTLLKDVLRRVVEERYGTGRRAQLPDYTLFGKTGTAQKPDPRGGGYLRGRHVSSFVVGAPVHAPEVVAYLLVDDPAGPGHHYGGQVAAPAAAHLIQRTLRYLGVPPDKAAETARTEPNRRR